VRLSEQARSPGLGGNDRKALPTILTDHRESPRSGLLRRESMTNELLRCPFCNGAAYGVPSGHGWIIRCGVCSARVVSEVHRESAEREWNSRVAIVPSKFDIEVMQERDNLRYENRELLQHVAEGYTKEQYHQMKSALLQELSDQKTVEPRTAAGSLD
jgi:hypothetical protein